MARPRKSLAAHVLHGSARPDRVNVREPQPELGEPTRPDWLLPEAKREWSRVVRELLAVGVLARVDRAALSAYCQAWARYVEAEQRLSELGPVFTTRNGYPTQRPECTISQKWAVIAKSFLAEFGLTPASRSRLSARPPEHDDPFAAYMRSKAGSGDDDDTSS